MSIYVVPQKPEPEALQAPSKSKESAFPPHAWQLSVFFDSSEKASDGTKDPCWKIQIEPGFVNGVDPRFPRAETDAIANAKKGDGPSKPVYSHIGTLLSGKEIGILDADPVKIRPSDWKDILAAPTGMLHNPEVIPAYFSQVFGIAPPPDITDSQTVSALQGGSNSLITQLADYQQNARLLYKMDVWIEQARSTFNVDISIPGNVVTGQLVDYSVGIDSTTLALGNRPRLTFGPIIPTKTIDTSTGTPVQLNPAYIDSNGNALGIDFLQIGTVYWVSPDQTVPDTKVKDPNDTDDNGTATWMPYYRHDVFYNLSYYKKNVIPFNLQQPTLDPFLAFFVGQYTFAPAATQGILNADEQAAVDSISNQVDQSGMFWTT
jgi:hypothetical protein